MSDKRETLKFELTCHLASEFIQEVSRVLGKTMPNLTFTEETLVTFVNKIPDLFVALNKKMIQMNLTESNFIPGLEKIIPGLDTDSLHLILSTDITFDFSILKEPDDIMSVQNHIRQIYKVYTGKELSLLKGVVPDEITGSVLDKLKELEENMNLNPSNLEEQIDSFAQMFLIDNTKESKVIYNLVKKVGGDFCNSMKTKEVSLSSIISSVLNGSKGEGDDILEKISQQLEETLEKEKVSEEMLQTYSEKFIQHFLTKIQKSGKSEEFLNKISGNPQISAILSKFGISTESLATLLSSKDLRNAVKIFSELEKKPIKKKKNKTLKIKRRK